LCLNRAGRNGHNWLRKSQYEEKTESARRGMELARKFN